MLVVKGLIFIAALISLNTQKPVSGNPEIVIALKI